MIRARSFLLAAALLAPAVARAQESRLAIRAAKRDSLVAGATVTAVFTVFNKRADSAQVMSHVDMPKDWTVILGGTPFDIGGNESSMLVLSFAVPSRAKAGTYPVRVWLTTKDDVKGTMDSLLVTVPRRSGLEAMLTSRPGYAISGNTYEAGFLVRNRGNAPAKIRVKVKSSLGAVAGGDDEFELGPEEGRGFRYQVKTPDGLNSATDDVLELVSKVVGDTLEALASARVTIVPEPSRKIEEFQRIPTQFNFRAATPNSASPIEAYGHGRIIDGKEPTLDFLFRGPAGAYSAFGERDEYRAELSTAKWRVRGGDNVFMLSQLSSSGQPGFGLGADADKGNFSFGGYGQEFRRQSEKGSETGTFVTYRPTATSRVGVNALSRVGGAMPGAIGSAVGSIQGDGYFAEAELARSKNGSSNGNGQTLRVSGRSFVGSFDFGHLSADTGFTGSQRGSSHNYLTARTALWENFSLGASASAHKSDLTRSTGVPYLEEFSIGNVSATLFNRYSMEIGGASRSTKTPTSNTTSEQASLRLRGDQLFAFGTVSLEAEGGKANYSSGGAKVFGDASLSLRHGLRNGSVAGYVGRYSGGAITKGLNASVSIGGDLTQRIGTSTDVSVIGYVLRQATSGTMWNTQVDGQVQYRLRTGNWIRFRARLMSGGSAVNGNQNVGYVEYGMPYGIPISKLRTVGRVYGRVVDAVTGNGIPNALVRLGPQVAITDKSGAVAFGGVPGGEHRLSMSQETSFTDAVFVGDPTLNVDSNRTQPTQFRLAIARSARVDIDVRRYAAVKTAVAGAPDSLKEVGAVDNATLVLIGERDTLYRTTNDDGKVSFTDIPPGTWKVLIRGDAPAFHRFDPDRMDLTLVPGDAKKLTFRLVPRKREVQVIGEGQELKATTADPKNQTAAPGTRVVKPNEQRPNEMRPKEQQQ